MTRERVSIGRTLVIAAALAAAACGTMKDKEPPPKPFIGTRWEVVLDLPMRGEQPYLRVGDGRIEGFGGCNNFTGRYLQDSVGARAVAVRALSVSKRLCDPSTNEAESRMLETLQAVSSYIIIADTMVLSGSAGSLKLRALPDEKRP
jgi:heat shock protein HslJ